MNQRIYSCRKKMALLLACVMLVFTIASNAQPVFAEGTVLTGTSGTINWTVDTLTGRLTISGSGTLENVSDMLGTQDVVSQNGVQTQKLSRLVKEVVVEEGITALGKAAFVNGMSFGNTIQNDSRWENLTSVTLPGSITSIPGGAFYGCSRLQTINLPQNITSIGDYAFYGTGVVSLSIPDSVRYIGSKAFHNCSSLKTLELPESFGVEKLSKEMFDGCVSLYDDNGFLVVNHVLLEVKADTESVVIPEGVTAIGEYLFRSNWSHLNQSVKELIIPEGVTTIGSGAFSISNLEKVTLPSTLQDIGGSAFYSCKLQSVTIPSGVQSIGESAFAYNDELQEVNLASGIQSIGDEAFYNCDKLTKVSFPTKPAKIGYDIFTDCDALLDSHNVVVFHDTIYGKKNLYESEADFYIASNITDLAAAVPREPDITLESGNTSFLLQNGTLYTSDYATLWHADPAESSDGKIQTFHVANGCKRIAYQAISCGGYHYEEGADGYSVEGQVTIPPSVTMIEGANEFRTVKGMDGSYAQQYAQYHNLKFEAIEMYGSLPADADNDGQVTLADAQLVLKGALKITMLSAAAQSAADMNGDGVITLDDAQVVLKGALKITALPAGEKLTFDSVIYDEFTKTDTKPLVPEDSSWYPSGSIIIGSGNPQTGDISTDYR